MQQTLQLKTATHNDQYDEFSTFKKKHVISKAPCIQHLAFSTPTNTCATRSSEHAEDAHTYLHQGNPMRVYGGVAMDPEEVRPPLYDTHTHARTRAHT